MKFFYPAHLVGRFNSGGNFPPPPPDWATVEQRDVFIRRIFLFDNVSMSKTHVGHTADAVGRRRRSPRKGSVDRFFYDDSTGSIAIEPQPWTSRFSLVPLAGGSANGVSKKNGGGAGVGVIQWYRFKITSYRRPTGDCT